LKLQATGSGAEIVGNRGRGLNCRQLGGGAKSARNLVQLDADSKWTAIWGGVEICRQPRADRHCGDTGARLQVYEIAHNLVRSQNCRCAGVEPKLQAVEGGARNCTRPGAGPKAREIASTRQSCNCAKLAGRRGRSRNCWQPGAGPKLQGNQMRC